MDTLGDNNTQYFYVLVKHKRLQYAITQLQDRKNVVQHNSDEIVKILLVEFHQDLLKKER